VASNRYESPQILREKGESSFHLMVREMAEKKITDFFSAISRTIR